ncbi:MAG: hypothetical protein KDD76_07050, partial [Rickettsiales bacterium]|nr:hypothetical protein [Rickettsiales bacterium]
AGKLKEEFEQKMQKRWGDGWRERLEDTLFSAYLMAAGSDSTKSASSSSYVTTKHNMEKLMESGTIYGIFMEYYHGTGTGVHRVGQSTASITTQQQGQGQTQTPHNIAAEDEPRAIREMAKKLNIEIPLRAKEETQSALTRIAIAVSNLGNYAGLPDFTKDLDEWIARNNQRQGEYEQFYGVQGKKEHDLPLRAFYEHAVPHEIHAVFQNSARSKARFSQQDFHHQGLRAIGFGAGANNMQAGAVQMCYKLVTVLGADAQGNFAPADLNKAAERFMHDPDLHHLFSGAARIASNTNADAVWRYVENGLVFKEGSIKRNVSADGNVTITFGNSKAYGMNDLAEGTLNAEDLKHVIPSDAKISTEEMLLTIQGAAIVDRENQAAFKAMTNIAIQAQNTYLGKKIPLLAKNAVCTADMLNEQVFAANAGIRIEHEMQKGTLAWANGKTEALFAEIAREGVKIDKEQLREKGPQRDAWYANLIEIFTHEQPWIAQKFPEWSVAHTIAAQQKSAALS